MAWDDEQVNQETSIDDYEWNNMVDHIKSLLKPLQTYEVTGADCTGNDGELNRVFELSNNETTQQIFVYVNGLYQHGDEVVINHKNSLSTIEFEKRLWNSDKITVLSYA